jgi:hypothetical protein
LMVRAVIEGWLEHRERTLAGGRGSHLGESGRRNAELGPDAGREQAHNSGGEQSRQVVRGRESVGRVF